MGDMHPRAGITMDSAMIKKYGIANNNLVTMWHEDQGTRAGVSVVPTRKKEAKHLKTLHRQQHPDYGRALCEEIMPQSTASFNSTHLRKYNAAR